MHAKTDAAAAATASLLESFGMELSAGGLLVMTDFAKAESAYIHHSRVPVTVVAMALASPTFARAVPKIAPARRAPTSWSEQTGSLDLRYRVMLESTSQSQQPPRSLIACRI
jgi:hypothetical protein